MAKAARHTTHVCSSAAAAAPVSTTGGNELGNDRSHGTMNDAAAIAETPITATDGEGAGGGSPPPLEYRPLSRPSDAAALAPIVCLLRSQIEAFVVTPDIRADARFRQNAAKRIDVGRVGIRCVHCVGSGAAAAAPAVVDPVAAASRLNGAVSYPKSIRLVNQTLRNWQRNHFPYCSAIPPEVRREYRELKSSKAKKPKGTKVSSGRYWEVSCREMGMVDASGGADDIAEGIELGPGGAFLSDDVIAARKEEKAREAEAEQEKPPPAESAPTSMEAGSADGAGKRKAGRRATKLSPSAGDHTPFVAEENGSAPPPPDNEGVATTTNGAAHPKGSTVIRPTPPDAARELDGVVSPPVSGCDGGGSTGARRHQSRDAPRPGDSRPLATMTATDRNDVISPSPVLQQNVVGVGQSPPPSPSQQQSHVLGEQQMTSTSISAEQDLICASPRVQQISVPGASEQARFGRPVDDAPTAKEPHAGGLVLSNEALLARVRLAVDIVQAAAEIRPVAPLEEEAAGLRPQHRRQETGGSDLTALGADLYELFSGRAPREASLAAESEEEQDDDDERLKDFFDDLFDDDAPGDGNGDSTAGVQVQQHRRKQERRRPESETPTTYVPLRDLGLPTALCCVVSSLMDSSDPMDADSDCPMTDSNGGINSGFADERYDSIVQVGEDLRLLADEPDKYLFHDNTTTGELRIPHDVLYGRAEEMLALLGAFDRTTSAEHSSTSAGHMVMISGYSGTGKSALVHGVESTFAERGACFVSGKFDAMRQPRPLSAIASALDDYCRILSRDTDRIDGVREAVEAAIGSEGAVLANLIPNLRNISSFGGSGDDAARTQVSGRESLQRILFMVRMLFWATCSRAHPVVLFLDDLQWADAVSLELMQVLVQDTMIEGLLFVGSYRDNEVGADHLLTTSLGNIRRSGNVDIVPIRTANLDAGSVSGLLSDALHLTPRTTRSLAAVVAKKTGGNALFTVQFLAALYDDRLLRFSLTSRRWEWDLDRIRNKDIADNVVELMTAKLLMLAPEVQGALCVAAGFGATCQESLLSIVDRSPDRMMSTIAALDVAVAEGLMVKSGAVYRFSHDQIQQASYLLVPESEREAFHLRIGRSIWKLSSEKETEDYLFVLVDQLHRGSSLITDCDEKIHLAQLSLLAAQMATAMSGFVAAASYLGEGIGLLVDEDWERHRELCFDLHNSCAETKYILGDFQQMTGLIETVLERANTLEEKLKVYLLLVTSSGSQGRVSDAISTTVAVLEQLGERFPATMNEATVKQERTKMQKLLYTKKDALEDLEPMVEPEKKVAMLFMRKLQYHIYATNRKYYVFIACRMVQLTLSYGACESSAYGLWCYGAMLCGELRDVQGGYQLGKLAISVAETYSDKPDVAEVKLLVHGGIYQWTQPIQASLPVFKEFIDLGLSFSATDFVVLANMYFATTSFSSGQPLGPLMEELQLQDNKISSEFQQHGLRIMTSPLRQTIQNLLGRSANPIELIGEELNENTLSLSDEGNGIFSFYYFFKMWLEYMFGKYELCWESAKRKQGFHLLCNYTFYSCLAALVLARIEAKTEYMEMISLSMAQMEEWVVSAPWNCEHKLELMKAEYAYLQGDIPTAAKAYDAAAETAARHSFQHEQAVALERAGIFYLECGDHDAASGYFKKAHYCYSQWGAIAKAAHVEETYL